MKRFYMIQQAERTADLYIFGDIVKMKWFDDETSAHSLLQDIKDLDVDQINVHIDSYGGAVSEGWAIYNALRDHPAKVVTYGDGFVASAALYPFMAGDERHASNLSAYYFHRVMMSASGYADDLRAAANEADMMTEIGIKAFTDRTDMTADQVRALMEAETWLTPERALELGVATSIIQDEAPKAVQSAKKAFFQRLMEPEGKPTDPPQEPKKPERKTEPGASLMKMLAETF